MTCTTEEEYEGKSAPTMSAPALFVLVVVWLTVSVATMIVRTLLRLDTPCITLLPGTERNGPSQSNGPSPQRPCP